MVSLSLQGESLLAHGLGLLTAHGAPDAATAEDGGQLNGPHNGRNDGQNFELCPQIGHYGGPTGYGGLAALTAFTRIGEAATGVCTLHRPLILIAETEPGASRAVGHIAGEDEGPSRDSQYDEQRNHGHNVGGA